MLDDSAKGSSTLVLTRIPPTDSAVMVVAMLATADERDCDRTQQRIGDGELSTPFCRWSLWLGGVVC